MSSYNNIRKIKYTKNPEDVVALQEYIIFEDSRAKEKFVVFRFANNVNQRLFEIKFEVLQYNSENELLEKSTVIHKNFTAEANDLFVPNAKLKVNFECASLEVRLESASFDRVIWSGGEFSDNSYSFDEYAEKAANNSQPAQKPQKQNNTTNPTKNKVKKNKFGFNIRNIFRKNKAVFPAVFNVILAVILIGLVIGSVFYFKSVTGAYSVDDFIVKQSDGYITVLNYSGDKTEVEIPDTLGEYHVAKIADGAFKKSKVTAVNIVTTKPLYIETGAFDGCSSLVSVSSSYDCGKITVMEGAFKNCSSLKTFALPTAELSKGCFDGTNAIKELIFSKTVFTEGKLLDLFVGLDSITLTTLSGNRTVIVPEDFYDGVRLG